MATLSTVSDILMFVANCALALAALFFIAAALLDERDSATERALRRHRITWANAAGGVFAFCTLWLIAITAGFQI